jgi:Right handed beta helix region/Secretion system C-terminal sorting domain
MKTYLLVPALIACFLFPGITINHALADIKIVYNSAELAKACQDAPPGRVIKIAAGTYTGPFQLLNKSNVTLESYNGQVTLQGYKEPQDPGMNILYIKNGSNIQVKNLRFTENWGKGSNGIKVEGAGSGLSITGCVFFNIGWGKDKKAMPPDNWDAHAIVIVGTLETPYTNITIARNLIYDCITGFSESLTVTGNVSNFLIEGNTLHSNTNIGIDCAGHYSWTREAGLPTDLNYARYGVIRNNRVYDYEGPDELDAGAGIYVDGASNITIERNRVYNYKVGISIGCESAGASNQDNIVRDNLVYNNHLSGIFVGSSTPTSMVNNTRITNNTCYKNVLPDKEDLGQVTLLNNTGTVIKNNILYPAGNRLALRKMVANTTSSLTISHNLYYRDNGNIQDPYLDPAIIKLVGDDKAVKSNPQFVNAPIDLHVKGTSAAINAGDPGFMAAAGELDIDAQARLQDNRVDIGVDEYARTAPAAPSSLTVPGRTYFSLTLRWRDNSNNELGFRIERSRGRSTSYLLVGTVGVGVTQYTDQVLASSTRYNYRVRAYNTGGASAYTAATATTTGLVLASPGSHPDTGHPGAFTVTLFPNPVRTGKATLFIQGDKEAALSVSIYDLSGRKLASLLENQELPAGTTVLDLNTREKRLPNGLYLLRVDHPEGPKTIRFSIE